MSRVARLRCLSQLLKVSQARHGAREVMSWPTLSLTRRERYAAQRGAIVFALRPPDRRPVGGGLPRETSNLSRALEPERLHLRCPP